MSVKLWTDNPNGDKEREKNVVGGKEENILMKKIGEKWGRKEKRRWEWKFEGKRNSEIFLWFPHSLVPPSPFLSHIILL